MAGIVRPENERFPPLFPPRRAPRAGAALLACLAGLVARAAFAGPVAMSASDFAFSLDQSNGTTWTQVGSGSVVGYFGPHRCACPVTLAPLLQLTASGQSNIGSSVIGVEFLLGTSCSAASASCTSLGKVAFSATQTATPPSFNSALVYQSAAGSTTVSCSSLAVGATSLWAVLTQDGAALAFTPSIELDVTAETVGAPTAVTATPGNGGLSVQWTAPANPALVAGYQVLCLPRLTTAPSPGYESCGLGSASTQAVLTPADPSQLCSAKLPATPTSIRISGLVNGTAYTVGVVAIDPSGGTSPLSTTVVGTPQPTDGFYEKYKQAGGAATGCDFGSRGGPSWLGLAVVAAFGAWRARRRRRSWKGIAALLACALATSAQAQVPDDSSRPADWSSPPRPPGDDWAANPQRSSNDWAANPSAAAEVAPPDWGLEVGFAPYRPDVDSEFGNGVHPFSDTFSSGHHLMSEAEVDRYLGHGFGSWGLGLRAGYFRATGSAFLKDGTRSNDETGLRILPLALSVVYRADGIPGLRRAALVPYAKAGLDLAVWTASTTGSPSHTGLTPGWHAACGVSLGLNWLGLGSIKRGEIAGPGSLFFEWDWAQLDGLGMSNRLHLGDSTWYAGLVFDL
jgi:hypothetical protein